jgi:Na+-transporting NADH:ubiquinone oxidoreductase subunit C
MVVIIAIALTVVAVKLKPAQQFNEKVEKMQNMLTSVNIESTPKNAQDLYNKYIKESLVVNSKGDIIPNVNAFEINMQIENKKKSEDKQLPVFICTNDKNEKLYIVPLRGKGLWGAIWGYVSFKEDLNTIAGTQFGHKSETPGLGAEIDTRNFQQQFENKKIFDEKNEFVSIFVAKGGAPDGNEHAVDAIAGGTITSKGLEAMLKDCIQEYVPYFKKIKK